MDREEDLLTIRHYFFFIGSSVDPQFGQGLLLTLSLPQCGQTNLSSISSSAMRLPTINATIQRSTNKKTNRNKYPILTSPAIIIAAGIKTVPAADMISATKYFSDVVTLVSFSKIKKNKCHVKKTFSHKL